MSDFSLLTDHPDYEDIICEIAKGLSPKDISQKLKIKYSEKNQKHLQLSQKLIQDFVDKHANLDLYLKKDVLAFKNKDSNLTDYKIAASLKDNKTYMERVEQLADTKIDIKKMIAELVFTCKERMVQVFDDIQQNPLNTRKDYVLLKYFETLFNATEKFDKIVNESPDQVIQINIQNQVTESLVVIFQEAIRETLTHIDPESALLFMGIFTEKFNALKLPKQVVSTPETYEAEAKLLREVIIPKLEK